MQSVFKEMRVPVQYSTIEDRATVATIFERVNRQGVAVDTLQLLSAMDRGRLISSSQT